MSKKKFNSPEYRAWAAMLCRCRNKNHEKYSRYGGRGISVCDRWLSFKNFLDDMGERPDGLSLDRIDNNKGYSPENCRWVSMKQQHRNRSNNRVLTFKGQKKVLREWSEEMGIHHDTLRNRLIRGWSVEKALTEPAAIKYKHNQD